MSQDGERSPEGDGVRVGEVFVLSIYYNHRLNEFHIEGLDVPPWLALGMLEYAQILVRRRDAEKVMAAAIQGARVLGVSGRVR